MLENRCKTAQTCRQDISTHGIGYVESVSYCLTWVRISLTCVISLWRNATNCTYNFMFPLKIRHVKNFNQSCLTAAFTFQRVCCPMNNVGVPTVVSTWARNTTYYWVPGRAFINTPYAGHRADSRFAPSQWETTLLCNDVSHWLGENLESAMLVVIKPRGSPGYSHHVTFAVYCHGAINRKQRNKMVIKKLLHKYTENILSCYHYVWRRLIRGLFSI